MRSWGEIVGGRGWHGPSGFLDEGQFSGKKEAALLEALGYLGKRPEAKVFLNRARSITNWSGSNMGKAYPTNNELKKLIEPLAKAAQSVKRAVSNIEASGNWWHLSPRMVELTCVESLVKKYQVPASLCNASGEDIFAGLAGYLHLIEVFSSYALESLPAQENTNKPEENAIRSAVAELADAYEQAFLKKPSGSKGTIFVRVSELLFPVKQEFIKGALDYRNRVAKALTAI